MSTDCCQGEIELLNTNLQYLLTKEKLLKKKYQQLLIENLQKDVIIKELEEKVALDKYSDISDILSSGCVSKLKQIGNSKREDSTFVRYIINDLYDQESLKKKTVSGRSKGSEKTPISPQNKKVLKDLFEKRLQSVDEEEEREMRKSCLNKLIRNAIDAAR